MNKLGIDPDKYKPTMDQSVYEKFSFVLINPVESFALKAGDIVYLLKPGSNNTSGLTKNPLGKSPTCYHNNNNSGIEIKLTTDEHETFSQNGTAAHDLYNIDEETFSIIHPSSPFSSHRLVSMHSMDEIWDDKKSPVMLAARIAEKRGSVATPYHQPVSRFNSFKKVFFPNVFNTPLKTTFREDSQEHVERAAPPSTVSFREIKENMRLRDIEQKQQQPHFSLLGENYASKNDT